MADAISKVSDFSFVGSPSKGNTQLKNAKDFCKNIEDYYIYNDDGQIVGIDYQKMYTQNKSKFEEFKDLNISINGSTEDSFVRQINNAQQDAADEETAKSDVNNSSKQLSDVQSQFSIVNGTYNLSSSLTKEENELRAQILTLNEKKIDLTKSESSSGVIIESARDFQFKAKQLEADVIDFTKRAKSEEEKESALSSKTQQEIYNSKNEIKINDTDDILANNPFWKNAALTFDVEEEAEAV